MSNIVIFGGGTVSHVRNHLGLCAWSRGTTARKLKQLLPQAKLVLTAMGSESSQIVTYMDLHNEVFKACADPRTSVIVMSCAIPDFEGEVDGIANGKHAARLQSRGDAPSITLRAVPKLIDDIKHRRPDIKIVGFKTTTGDTIEQQRDKAERMGVDYVIANDVVNRRNLLNGVEMSREQCLEALALQLDVRRGILYEDESHYLVRLGVKGYVSKPEAFGLAQTILNGKEYSNSYFWSDKLEGVLVVQKVPVLC
ncbi:MAG: hypothetical protein GY776_08995 [Alteromonas sp.]|nr:hypothetical protein [Alteromonas sp.]